MGNKLKHFKTITKHKFLVGHYCFKLGLYKQGLLHDNSKYSRIEFKTSAKYFQGNSTPVAAEKKALGYSYAWQHHQNANPHHWEYWIDFHDGEVFAVKIPFKYVLEILCDMISAGKVYERGKWTSSSPLNFYSNEKNALILNEETRDLLERLLETINAKGLKDGMKIIKKIKKTLKKNY